MEPAPADNRKLSELVTLCYHAHGQHLKDGARRKSKLLDLCDRLGNPVGRLLEPAHFTRDRDARIKSGISAKTCNNEHGYLNSVFNELHRTGEVKYATPIASLRMIKLSENELT